jgi:hypothetical protein
MSTADRWKWIAAWLFGGIYLLVLVVLLWQFGFGGYPLSQPWTDKGSWDHAIALFNSLSAIGAAAIGVILGTKIEQVKVETAKKEAGEAKTKLENLSKASTKLLFRTTGAKIRSDDSGTLEDAQENLRQAIAEADALLKLR